MIFHIFSVNLTSDEAGGIRCCCAAGTKFCILILPKFSQYRQNYQNCSNLYNDAILLHLTKRYFILVLISDINAYNDGRGGAVPQARNFVFKFVLLVSSHSKFLDEFQLLFTEWHRRFLNSTPVLCTDRHRGDILRFEIMEPTEPLIFISLVTLESFPLPRYRYRSENLNWHEIGNR